MSDDWFKDVKDFHEKVIGEVTPDFPCLVSLPKRELRQNLIEEEITETLIAIDDNDLEGIADGIADSIVVLLGTAVTYGIDMRPVWDEVHKTNMAKAGGKFRNDGKLLKPEGWESPDIASIIADLIKRGMPSCD